MVSNICIQYTTRRIWSKTCGGGRCVGGCGGGGMEDVRGDYILYSSEITNDRFTVNLLCVGMGKDAGILSSGRLLRWMLFVISWRKRRWLSFEAILPFQ